ncbi:sensor histidine kinase [Acidicapsa dinghuensis]|uniref:histidine kinase n=1 Tax=Acidicapsa dinghuensis TaxID=2218256 RepID=A0ABW1EIS9_9BACT|nr:histidine kinase [Acidicapsa dinghuensis]
MLLGSLAQWWSWGLITPIIFWVDAHLPFKENQLGRRIAAQLLPSLALTVLYIYVFAAVLGLLGLAPWSMLAGTRLLANAFRGSIFWGWLVYWLIFGARQTFRYYQRYLASELQLERLERSFSQARLNALRMQLDPHFLFNALNTISSQVERDPRLARSMIEHLGDLLRLSLEARGRQEVPLAEEMAFLDHYIAIQKIRFGSSLGIETYIDPEVKYALVPCFIVQPLVENAIRHGISCRASGGSVRVTAQRRDEYIEIRVTDNGVGLPPGWMLESSTGLGLSVTRERIAGLHPNGNSRFAVRRRSGGGTEVEISLPLRLAGVIDDDRAAN